MRQIVLDTETTGLQPQDGHRIIEVGCVEVQARRLTGNNYHQYLQPDREIDDGAIEVHGITNEMLANQPRFDAVVDELIEYLRGAELIIHNAPFDVGFLNHEFEIAGRDIRIEDICTVTDTLVMARRLHPGQRNSLDALCNRYHVNNSHRELHGALLDSEILADVYLLMTGGQAALSLGGEQESDSSGGVHQEVIQRLPQNRPRLKVVKATEEELAAHEVCLQGVDKASGGACVWLKQD